MLSASAFEERIHLAWGDVTVDQACPPAMVRVHLKCSKCDQLGKGVDVFVGRTDSDVCPVTLILSFVRRTDRVRGPFSDAKTGRHSRNPILLQRCARPWSLSVLRHLTTQTTASR